MLALKQKTENIVNRMITNETNSTSLICSLNKSPGNRVELVTKTETSLLSTTQREALINNTCGRGYLKDQNRRLCVRVTKKSVCYRRWRKKDPILVGSFTVAIDRLAIPRTKRLDVNILNGKSRWNESFNVIILLRLLFVSFKLALKKDSESLRAMWKPPLTIVRFSYRRCVLLSSNPVRIYSIDDQTVNEMMYLDFISCF